MTEIRPSCIPAGVVVEANFASKPPRFVKPTKQTSARRAGLIYERKAQGYILRKLEEVPNKHRRVTPSPWIVFRSKGDGPNQVRYCQPDCLIFDGWERKITIVEIKLQHCAEAYNQVRKLYEPVLKVMYPNYQFAALELVQWFDPHIPFVETYYFEPHICDAETNRFAIHIWNPRYDKQRRSTQPSNQIPPPG